MEKLIPFIMCAFFVLISFGFWALAVKLSSYAARQKILAHKNAASKEATSVLLMSHFGEFSVLHNICLPIKTEKALLYVKIDNIVILPTCIAVVQVESMSGQIFNGDSRIWRQSIRMPDGTHKKKDFENPITNNERNIIALSSIFEKKKIQSPILRNIIIFSSDNVIFSDDCPEVYSLSTAIEKMKVLSKGDRIPLGERLKLIRTIKKCSVPVSYARAHNAKVLNMQQTGTNNAYKKTSTGGTSAVKNQNTGAHPRPKN